MFDCRIPRLRKDPAQAFVVGLLPSSVLTDLTHGVATGDRRHLWITPVRITI